MLLIDAVARKKRLSLLALVSTLFMHGPVTALSDTGQQTNGCRCMGAQHDT